MNPFLIMPLLLLTASAVTAQTPTVAKPLVVGTPAPELTAIDSAGAPVRLAALRGQRIYVGMLRSTGCPVCNLRHHQLAQALGSRWGAQVLLVYPSSQQNLSAYQSDQKSPFILAVDRSGATHAAYGVGKSFGKVFKGTFNGLLRLNAEGKKQYGNPVPDDVSKLQGTADFLIDENGRIALAFYPRYAGEALPISVIQQFLETGHLAQ